MLKLRLRDGPHLQDTEHKVKDFQYPATNQMRFDNPIVGFVHKPGNWCGVNVILKNGQHSELPLKVNNGRGYAAVYMNKQDTHVSRVVMKGDNEFGGVIFFDKYSTKLLEAGHC